MVELEPACKPHTGSSSVIRGASMPADLSMPSRASVTAAFPSRASMV